MDNRELQKLVNPVYTTAKGTVMMLLRGGDPDAQRLAAYLDLAKAKREVDHSPTPEFLNCYAVAQEARYGLYNEAALRSGKPIIVDLPCGYSPRGFRVVDRGLKYFGLDLPVVIDEMKPAAASVIQSDDMVYAAVDATNYESLRGALGDVHGELCIVTEGLLGYFSESELVSMCRAVHRLLSEFGGCWITADVDIIEIYTLTFGELMKGDMTAFTARMNDIVANLSDTAFSQNSLFANGPDGAKRFLREQGFHVRAESVSAYLPTLRTVTEDVAAALADAYGKMEIYTLTVDENAASTDAPARDLPFAVESELKDGVFTVSVQGRMDTITAPELLKRFQEAGDGIESIHVDVSRMAYVSSAGLRVLLMMYKSLDNRDNFTMTGASPEVREILETTGFDQFLLRKA